MAKVLGGHIKGFCQFYQEDVEAEKMCVTDMAVIPLIHKSKSLTQIFQNFSSLHVRKEILVEERAGEGGIQVKTGNYQPNSLFPHRLCIGFIVLQMTAFCISLLRK